MPSKKPRAVDEAAETIAASCLVGRVRMVHRTITSIYDDALRPLGLTSGQLNILVAVAKGGPVAPGLVARRLSMEKSTISRNVARMRGNGWLLVGAGETGREQRLSLSKAGEAVLLEALPLWKGAQTKAKAVFGTNGAESIISLGDSVWSQLDER